MTITCGEWPSRGRLPVSSFVDRVGDLDERSVNVETGSSAGVSAVLQRAFVDHAGQVPR
jgi:hypothetical protein